MEQSAAERKQFSTPAIGKPTEIANPGQTPRQSVLQETTQELLAGQSLGALPIVVSVVLPSEGDIGPVDRNDSMIGYGHAMRIAGQVLEYVLSAAKRRLGINDPVLVR